MRFRVRCRCVCHSLLSVAATWGRILFPIITVFLALPTFWFVISYYGPDMFWGIIGAGFCLFFTAVGIHHAARMQLADRCSPLFRAKMAVKSRLARLSRKPDGAQALADALSVEPNPMSDIIPDPHGQVSWEDTIGDPPRDEHFTDEDFGLKWFDGCLVDTVTGEVVSFPADENMETPDPFEFQVIHRNGDTIHIEPTGPAFPITGPDDDQARDRQPAQQELEIPDPKPLAVVYIP